MEVDSLRFRALGGSGALALACTELTLYHPALKGPEFLTSVSAIFERSEYGAFLVERSSVMHGGVEHWTRVGIGLFCIYPDHWMGRPKLAVEAACFDPESADAQRVAWSGLLEVARENALDGLYLKLETISPSEPLKDLLRMGGWDRFVVRHEYKSLIQASSEGIWSAFMGRTRNQATFVDCVRVQEPAEVNLSGVRTNPAILFRGEGRVAELPYATCPDLRALIDYVHQNGFTPRAAGVFSGSLVEQIRHQGYVASPTVSLTSDPLVAGLYATAAGKRTRAAVFAIDTSVLDKAAPVWDSFESMRTYHRAFLQMDFDSIVKLVRAYDVQVAGSILEALHEGLRTRRQQYEDTLGLQAEPSAYLEEAAVRRAGSVLTDEEFLSLCSVLEHAVPYEGRGYAHESIVATPYGAAFHMALPELTQALERARRDVWRHPGWDTTVFGYIAKTCRDREFFSSGGIPAEAIKEARVVDAGGNISETVFNPRYANP
jgi:hypothetical protein